MGYSLYYYIWSEKLFLHKSNEAINVALDKLNRAFVVNLLRAFVKEAVRIADESLWLFAKLSVEVRQCQTKRLLRAVTAHLTD